jgi:hypothetical protein
MWLTPAVAGLVQIPYPARVLCAVVLVCVGQGIGIAGMVAFRRARTTVNPIKASFESPRLPSRPVGLSQVAI